MTKSTVKIWIAANAVIGICMCQIASNNYLVQSFWWVSFDLLIAALNFNAAYVNYIMIKDSENE